MWIKIIDIITYLQLIVLLIILGNAWGILFDYWKEDLNLFKIGYLVVLVLLIIFPPSF